MECGVSCGAIDEGPWSAASPVGLDEGPWSVASLVGLGHGVRRLLWGYTVCL